MSHPSFEQLPDDHEMWGDPAYPVSPDRPVIQLIASTDGDPPDADYIGSIVRALAETDALVLAAAELILEEYDYEHFRSLGVSEALLVRDETAESIAAVITLKSVWFTDCDCESFEMSFTAPWDSRHTFDVEFEDGEATCCAVNG